MTAKIDSGKVSQVLCHLTTLYEFKNIFGTAHNEATRQDGGVTLLILKYENGTATFRKSSDNSEALFAIVSLQIDGKFFDLGCNLRPVLRNEKDLLVVNQFQGLSNLSLKNLDLRSYGELLSRLPFDTLTEWPDKLPVGFEPAKLLELGKNPGLGIRTLHAEGITGKGIGLAIIDQPLLRGHLEYAAQLDLYDDTAVPNIEPQMHSAAVASLAVGKTLGVAPAARLYFFATPTWKMDNLFYAEALEKVIKINASLPKQKHIRVVSLSFGGFRKAKNYPRWEQVLKKAEAMGILVTTCDQEAFLPYLNLELDFTKDPDVEDSWRPTSWTSKAKPGAERLYAPGGNRTIASFRGSDTYQLERTGGLSWTAPYFAGLAALVFQVRPELTVDQVKKLIRKTASQKSFGKMVNPRKLIAEARKLPLNNTDY